MLQKKTLPRPTGGPTLECGDSSDSSCSLNGFPIPTGLRLPAQGCEERATLGFGSESLWDSLLGGVGFWHQAAGAFVRARAALTRGDAVVRPYLVIPVAVAEVRPLVL